MSIFIQKPYAVGKGWEIWHGDSFDVLVQMRASGVRVDATITDVPYSSGGQFRGDRAAGSSGKYLQSGSAILDNVPAFEGDTRDQRSFGLWCNIWIRHCMMLMRTGGVFASFIDWRQLAQLIDAIQVGGIVYRGLLPWTKPPGAVRPQRGRFSQSAEFVPWGTKGAAEVLASIGFLAGHKEQADDVPLFNGSLDAGDLAAIGREEKTVEEVLEVLGYITAASPRGKDREHATEKPPKVCDWLVSSVPVGSVILDPFCGSAAIGEAALRRDCYYIGIELSREIADMAVRRMMKAERTGRPTLMFPVAEEPPAPQPQLPLFGARAPAEPDADRDGSPEVAP